MDDVAEACICFRNKNIKETIVNIGTGKDYTINEYAKEILKLIIPNKKIKIKYDLTKPNGTLRKILDVSLTKKYGWRAKINLKKGIINAYQDYLEKY